jgi:hypothetical protein
MQAIRTAFCGAAVLVIAASDCAVVSAGVAVVSTAAAVTTGVASTAVDDGVGAVKVTAKVVGKGVDAITPSAPPQPRAAPHPPQPVSN